MPALRKLWKVRSYKALCTVSKPFCVYSDVIIRFTHSWTLLTKEPYKLVRRSLTKSPTITISDTCNTGNGSLCRPPRAGLALGIKNFKRVTPFDSEVLLWRGCIAFRRGLRFYVYWNDLEIILKQNPGPTLRVLYSVVLGWGQIICTYDTFHPFSAAIWRITLW